MIKNLGLPNVVEKKLEGCVNYVHTSSKSANLLLLGCPQKYISKILEAVASEAGVNSKLVENTYLKQGNLAQVLTNLAEGDFVCFSNIGVLNSELMLILKQAILDSQLNITFGKGRV